MAVIRERRGTGVHGVVAQNVHTGCCAAARSAPIGTSSAVPPATSTSPSTASFHRRVSYCVVPIVVSVLWLFSDLWFCSALLCFCSLPSSSSPVVRHKCWRPVFSAGMPKSRPWTVTIRQCKCLIQASCQPAVSRPWVQGQLLCPTVCHPLRQAQDRLGRWISASMPKRRTPQHLCITMRAGAWEPAQRASLFAGIKIINPIGFNKEASL